MVDDAHDVCVYHLYNTWRNISDKIFGRQGSNDNNKSAMDMLNQQLASGKITEDEYQRKKKLINEK